MYPRNAASPEPVAIGAVIQITDGAVQTSGVTVRIKPIGVAEADGGGTTAYSTDGIILYTPTQAETNYTSFILIAKKTGCIPTSVTVVTSASATAGYAGTDQSKIANPTSTVALTGTTIATTQKVDVETIKTNPVVNGGTITFPSNATLASTTNITAGTITTVTTVTNQLTAAQIATGVWQDTTAGDFTTALSVGKSLMNGVALGTGLTVARCTLTDTLTTYTGNTPQTGDSFARLGAPAGASVSADVAAIKTDTGNLVTRITSTLFSGITSLAQWLGLLAGKQSGNTTARTELRATGAGSGTYDEATDSIEAIRDRGDAAWTTATGFSTLTAADVRSAVGLASANLDTQLTAIDDYLDTEIAAIKAKTDNLPAAPAATGDCITAAGVRAAVGLASANLDTQLSAIAGYIDTEVAAILAAVDTEVGAIKTVTDAIGATGSGLSAIPWNAAWDAEVQSECADALTAYNVAAVSNIPSANTIADTVLGRSVSNVEGSAAEHSLCSIVLATLESAISGTTWTIKRTDGSTTYLTKTLTTDAAADPITGVA